MTVATQAMEIFKALLEGEIEGATSDATCGFGLGTGRRSIRRVPRYASWGRIITLSKPLLATASGAPGETMSFLRRNGVTPMRESPERTRAPDGRVSMEIVDLRL